MVIKGGIREERIYFGNYEIYRKYNGAATPTFERQSLHIMDDKQRIALVEIRTIGNETGEPVTRFRYQLSNYLGSSVTEIDETAQAKIISHEEYYPYGGTAYIGGSKEKANEKIASTKRYRYSGKERDDETGMYYYGARYYAPWLGRFCACDPIGINGGMNVYTFVINNPVRFVDLIGLEPEIQVDDFGGERLHDPVKGSADYSPGELKNASGKQHQKVRGKGARNKLKSDKVSSGKGIKQGHHHSDVDVSKKVDLNTDIMNEQNRMSYIAFRLAAQKTRRGSLGGDFECISRAERMWRMAVAGFR